MGFNRFERLRHYLSEIEEKILSASELARLLNVSKALITSIEKGSLPPSPKVAARLEEKYDISVQWYLTGEGLAPWEIKIYADVFERIDELVEGAEEGKTRPVVLEITIAFLHSGFKIFDTPEKKLVNYFIEAGRTPEFRRYLYNVLYHILEGGAVNNFQELQRAREKTEGKKEYKWDKFQLKELRQMADKGQKKEEGEK